MNAGTLNKARTKAPEEVRSRQNSLSIAASAQQPCCSECSGTEAATYPCNEGVMLITDSVESRLLERVHVNSERQAIDLAEEREASLRTCILQPIVGCGATQVRSLSLRLAPQCCAFP